MYHGPREHVLDFFEPLGFRCPERKGIADFLQEVTSRKDQKVRMSHTMQLVVNCQYAKASSLAHSLSEPDRNRLLCTASLSCGLMPPACNIVPRPGNLLSCPGEKGSLTEFMR